ncbi:MAG: hypothetical protein AAF389_18340 [Gemmatimonadota bacterium]
MTKSNKRLQRGAALVAGALFLAACAGENLFSVTAAVGGTGPSVDITTPTANFSLAVGDSILIQATITATAGGSTVDYNGWYVDDGSAAYTGESDNLNSLPSVNVSNYLLPVTGQVAGDAYIVVTVTDNVGATGVDSVKVTIN